MIGSTLMLEDSVKRHLELPILGLLFTWGMYSAFQGAAFGMFVYGPHTLRDSWFISLVYSSLIAGVMISLISARLAAVVLVIAAFAASLILYKSNFFGHGPATAIPFLWAIAVRPLLASLLLLALPPVGPLVRLFRKGSI